MRQTSLFILLLAGLLTGCHSHKTPEALAHNLGVIPAPASVTSDFQPSEINSLRVFLPDSLTTDYLRLMVNSLPKTSFSDESSANVKVAIDTILDEEEYTLEISSDKVTVRAGSSAGVQYALTSLGQIAEHRGYPLPVAVVRDKPKFKYRGMHLDVGRHFFDVADVKKYLDYMAMYKYNNFHWHLTEDQGWRIEIKKYPRLQEVAAFRKETLIGHYSDQPHKFDGKRYGGYYTQEEVREIVRYASDRHINVIPEIEMPGHSLAALAAYPQLGCRLDRTASEDGNTGKLSEGQDQPAYEVATKWGVFEDVYCPTEYTFGFLEDVIDEVIQLFPGKYIHIGGDEVPKVSWKNSLFCQNLIREKGLDNEEDLQSYFITRMEKYINSKGRQIIGWDEILEGGLAPNATVMSWRGIEGGLAAARQDHDVIMTPGSHCYFDHYQSESPDEPVAIGGLTTVEKVYHWEPVPPELEPEKQKYILGGQANLWTEYIPDFSKVEYMVFSRGMAMSEALWGTNKDYAEFLKRFLIHEAWWRKKGANMANHIYDLYPVIAGGNGSPVTVSFHVPEGEQIIMSTGKGDKARVLPGIPVKLDKGAKYSFAIDRKDIKPRACVIEVNDHPGRHAILTLDSMPDQKYKGHGAASLNNGIRGPIKKFNHPEWLGWQGPDASGVYDFGKAHKISNVTFRFFNEPGSWIHLPSGVELLVSNDGKDWQEAAKTSISDGSVTGQILDVALDISSPPARYLKFRVKSAGTILPGNPGAGDRSWLFMDEIIIN